MYPFAYKEDSLLVDPQLDSASLYSSLTLILGKAMSRSVSAINVLNLNWELTSIYILRLRRNNKSQCVFLAFHSHQVSID